MVAPLALALGWAGTAGADDENRGLRRCRAKLATCNANLRTCSTDLTQAQGNLATCNTNLGTCNTSLSQSQANLATCTNDLAACQAAAQAFPATGQTTVHRAGDDGAIQAGADLSYTDTGVGTIIDNNTGLEWEKKSDDELVNDNNNTTFPHDKDNVYTWEDAFAVHVAGLNTPPCFAGFCDWRLPNIKELQSIVNYEVFSPSVSSAFNNNCAGATVLTGSCTAASNYWSSNTFASSSAFAWGRDLRLRRSGLRQ